MIEERRKSDGYGERMATIEANIQSILGEIKEGREETRRTTVELKAMHQRHFDNFKINSDNILETRGIAESAKRHAELAQKNLDGHLRHNWEIIVLVATVIIGIAGIVVKAMK